MDALNWLEEHLSAQNTSLQSLEDLEEALLSWYEFVQKGR